MSTSLSNSSVANVWRIKSKYLDLLSHMNTIMYLPAACSLPYPQDIHRRFPERRLCDRMDSLLYGRRPLRVAQYAERRLQGIHGEGTSAPLSVRPSLPCSRHLEPWGQPARPVYREPSVCLECPGQLAYRISRQTPRCRFEVLHHILGKPYPRLCM